MALDFKGILALFVVLVSVLTTVLGQGYGCDDGYLPDEDRVDCMPDGGNENVCRIERNCTWCPSTPGGSPWCYIPGTPRRGGYLMVGEPVVIDNGFIVNLEMAPEEGGAWRQGRRWDNEAETLTLLAEFQSNSRLHIKITEPGVDRWEVPLRINPPSEPNTSPLYDISFENDPLFSFKVTRRSSGAVLLDAAGDTGNFIYAEQYITLSWRLPSEYVYGIGENEQPTFKHDFSRNLSWPLWARDATPGFTNNIYGVQPYYTVLEEDGSAHSVALINSNAQEWVMQAAARGPQIRYNTIGGVLDFYVFLGPTPENTVQQYTEAVGRAQMPPYWALGFQLCRYGYNNIEAMKRAVDRTAQYQIPHDVQYGDIDIMERELDFTYSETNFPGLPGYIRELKEKGIKFMTILDPCISIGEPVGSYRPYDLGEEMDVWMKRADGSNAVGRVWPDDPVYFPDYSNPRTREWWITLIEEFHTLLEYDGLWIDMNEPANFVAGDVEGCESNKYNNPAYIPRIIGGYLPAATVCMDNQEHAGMHYNTHSMFGWFESEPTLAGTRAGTGKRALVLSRSTFLGSGHWAAHWLGDNFSQWSNLHFSIIGMLQFNHFGIPFVGADICGFNGNTDAGMCQRWMELGAFYPFARNHNGMGNLEQDPGAFGQEVAASSRRALEVRYTLLPYLYTLFYEHNTMGSTVVRALWHEFPTDLEAAVVDRQFLWGSGVLISPALTQGAITVRAYFPHARFYSFYDGAEVGTKGGYETLGAPSDFIPVHIHGGNVIPTQEPAVNTQLSRNKPFGLIVALDSAGGASGRLYFDDGDSIDPVETGAYFEAQYTVAARRLTVTVVSDGYPGMVTKTLNTIRLLGAGPVTAVTVNGVNHTSFRTLPSGEVVIEWLGLPANSEYTVTF